MIVFLLNLEPYQCVRGTLSDPAETNCAPLHNNLDRFAPTTSSAFEAQRFPIKL